MTLYIRCGLVFILSMGLCASVLSHDGEVKITGTIQDNTCELAPDSQNKRVEMGIVAARQFTHAGDSSPAQSFSIELQNCGPAASEAAIMFSGAPDKQNSDLFQLNEGDGASTGLALGIYNGNGTLIAPEGSSMTEPLTPGQHSVKLNFRARYVAVQDNITIGTAFSTITFTMKYN